MKEADAGPAHGEPLGTAAAMRIGPAGWSYADWKGVVYPPGMPRAMHALTYLAQFFDTVEINSSYYRPPDPKHSADWVDRVVINPGFRFTAKLWQRFTHERGPWPSTREVREFRNGLRPLQDAGKLGALLVQFPWSFKRTPDTRRWLARVFEAFADFPLALEIRHASWHRPEVLEGLAARGIAFCNIDQPLFQDSLGPTEVVTGSLGYVRLHGRNTEHWFRKESSRDERYDYLYSREELQPWVAALTRMRSQAHEVYAVTNNHFEGQAVVNAFELQAALGVQRRAAPSHLTARYPRLAAMDAPQNWPESGRRE